MQIAVLRQFPKLIYSPSEVYEYCSNNRQPLLVSVTATLLSEIPSAEMVTTCRAPANSTDILPENPPPLTESVRRLSLNRPLTSPEALKVRSSHVPTILSPRA